MFIFLNTQKSGTASDKFFKNLMLKCDKDFEVIKVNQKGILSLFSMSHKLRDLLECDYRFNIISDCGCFKTLLIIILAGFYNKNIKIYTSFYHHVFTLEECLRFFQINEIWKLISLKLFSIFEKLKTFNNLKILTVSQFSKDNIVNKFLIDEDRVLILWNQIIEKNIKNSNYLGKGYIKNESYLLIISTLIKRKNLTLIKKISQFYGCKIKFVCPTPNTKNKLKIINYLKINNVKIYHDINDHKLKNLYLNASCILIPSLYEGLSLIPLESIQYSKPFIMSQIKPHLFWELPDKFYFNLNDYNNLLKKINFYLKEGSTFIDYSHFQKFNNIFNVIKRERKENLYKLYNDNY